MGFSSPEDLMKYLPKAMGNIAGMIGEGPTDSPTFKLSMRELRRYWSQGRRESFSGNQEKRRQWNLMSSQTNTD